MFQNEYKQLYQLLNERVIEPFEFSVDDTSDDESTTAHATNTQKNVDNGSEDDSDDEDEFYDAVSFDDLFVQHQQWLTDIKTLRPCYKQCVELAREGKQKHAELQKHMKEILKPKSQTSSKKWSLFDEISTDNDSYLYDKKKKQLELRIEEINAIIGRFNDDVDERNEKLSDWEERVASKWQQIASLFGLYGVPMTKSSVATLQWLYKKDIVGNGYLGLFDIGHYLCSALLPHRKSIVCGGILAQFVATLNVDWMTTARAIISSEVLYFLYPKLRAMRTSEFAIRTDTIIAMLVMYTCDVDLLTNLGVCSVVQLWMLLCTNDMAIHYPYDSGDGDENDINAGVNNESEDEDETETSHTKCDSDQDCVVQTTDYNKNTDDTQKTLEDEKAGTMSDDKQEPVVDSEKAKLE